MAGEVRCEASPYRERGSAVTSGESSENQTDLSSHSTADWPHTSLLETSIPARLSHCMVHLASPGPRSHLTCPVTAHYSSPWACEETPLSPLTSWENRPQSLAPQGHRANKQRTVQPRPLHYSSIQRLSPELLVPLRHWVYVSVNKTGTSSHLPYGADILEDADRGDKQEPIRM